MEWEPILDTVEAQLAQMEATLRAASGGADLPAWLGAGTVAPGLEHAAAPIAAVAASA